MLYKMSLSVNEIPPLFVELDELNYNEASREPEYWKEKARWIRFEEQAEDVLGRWSKPHVATLPHTAIDELKDMLQNGVMMFDALLTDMKEIAGRSSLLALERKIAVLLIKESLLFACSRRNGERASVRLPEGLGECKEIR